MARHRRFRRGLGPAEGLDVQHQHRQRQTHLHPSGDRDLSAPTQKDRHVHASGGQRERRQDIRHLFHSQGRGRSQPTLPGPGRRRTGQRTGAAEPAGSVRAGIDPEQRPVRHGHRVQPGHLHATDPQQEQRGQGRACHRHAEILYPCRRHEFRGRQIPHLQRILEQGDRFGQQSGIQAGECRRNHLQRCAPAPVGTDSPAERHADHRPGRDGLPGARTHFFRQPALHLRRFLRSVPDHPQTGQHTDPAGQGARLACRSPGFVRRWRG